MSESSARSSGGERSPKKPRVPWWGQLIIGALVGSGGVGGGLLAKKSASEQTSDYREKVQDESIAELKVDTKDLHNTVNAIDTSVKVMAEAARANVEATSRAIQSNEAAVRELREERRRYRQARDYYTK